MKGITHSNLEQPQSLEIIHAVVCFPRSVLMHRLLVELHAVTTCNDTVSDPDLDKWVGNETKPLPLPLSSALSLQPAFSPFPYTLLS